MPCGLSFFYNKKCHMFSKLVHVEFQNSLMNFQDLLHSPSFTRPCITILKRTEDHAFPFLPLSSDTFSVFFFFLHSMFLQGFFIFYSFFFLCTSTLTIAAKPAFHFDLHLEVCFHAWQIESKVGVRTLNRCQEVADHQILYGLLLCSALRAVDDFRKFVFKLL